MVRIVIVLLVAISGYLIFEYGRISAGYDVVEAGNVEQAYIDHIQVLDKEIIDLKQGIAILETNREVDRASYKEATRRDRFLSRNSLTVGRKFRTACTGFEAHTRQGRT